MSVGGVDGKDTDGGEEGCLFCTQGDRDEEAVLKFGEGDIGLFHAFQTIDR